MNNCNEDLYLLPNDGITEIVLVEDSTTNGGFLYSNKGVFVVNSYTMNLVKNSFIENNSLPIQSFLMTSNDILWFNAALKTNLFKLAEYPARKRVNSQYYVEAGQVINPVSTLQPIQLKYSGNVTNLKCNSTLIYSYVSNENSNLDIEENVNYCTSALLYNNYSSDICPRGYIYQNNSQLTPQEDVSGYGSSCTNCSQCSNCIYCFICVFSVALASLSIGTSSCVGTASSC